MSFFIKLSTIVFLAGAIADPIDSMSSRGSWALNGIIGSNPIGNLIDARELQDSSFLDQLDATNIQAESGSGGAQPAQPFRYSHSGPILNSIRNSAWDFVTSPLSLLCPSSIKNFNSQNDVKFTLYNKNYPRGVAIGKDFGEEKLLSNVQIKFVIHGFLDGENYKMLQTVKNAYMERDEDYNVITVDWTKGSGNWLAKQLNCVVKFKVVPKVGEAIADLILDLIDKQDTNILYVTLVGHSLGAHVAGIAAKKLDQAGQKVPRIVGLDPALPGFKNSREQDRLAPTDAIYVEVIHTNPDKLGFMTPLGTADFYPNYGRDWSWLGNVRQPTCFLPSCSHAWSFELFAESIRNPTAFQGVRCDNLDDMKKGRCGNNESPIFAFMGGADMRYGKQPGIFAMVTNKDGNFKETTN